MVTGDRISFLALEGEGKWKGMAEVERGGCLGTGRAKNARRAYSIYLCFVGRLEWPCGMIRIKDSPTPVETLC